MDNKNEVICTLFEGDYHVGVGALINSLVRAGFNGEFFAFFRGNLPSWASGCSASGKLVVGSLTISFLSAPNDRHLSNFKARALLSLAEVHAPKASCFFYFDPDIVIKCNWTEFSYWASRGVALVEDVQNGKIGDTHPLRARWADHLGRCGYEDRFRHLYCNSGFIGVPRSALSLLVAWDRVMEQAQNYFRLNKDTFMFHEKGREFPFISFDQDCLNCALQSYEGGVSIAGPEAMDFAHGGYFMSHAIASPKPWRGRVLRGVLEGRTPSLAQYQFWLNVSSPIRLYSPFRVRAQRLKLAIASFICRFYKRA